LLNLVNVTFMSRIKTEKLHDALTSKKENYQIRVTAFIKGSVKERFLNDCIQRECNESKMNGYIIDTYYSVIDSFPSLRGQEPNEIKKFIINNIKFE
jgi:hypothetical protein